MRKRYKSNMIIAIRLENGRRVSFEPTSDGGSYFDTDNLQMQSMLESHPLFGKQFNYDRTTLTAMLKAKAQASRPVAPKPQAMPSAKTAGVPPTPSVVPSAPQEETQPAPSTSDKKVVKVASVADAKNYLVENCGVYRSALRSKKDILDSAAKCGIKFEGL